MKFIFEVSFNGVTIKADAINSTLLKIANRSFGYDTSAQLLQLIAETRFCGHPPTEDVIEDMLKILVVTQETDVFFCTTCAKYVLCSNPNETVCAYHESGSDSHQVFHIGIHETDERLFLCIWGIGYTDDPAVPKTQTVGMDFFTPDGYTVEDVACIDKLVIGESYCSTESNHEMHTIVRLY